VADRFVLAGPASRGLGESVAAKLKIPTLPYDFKVFPDGETRLRVEEKVSRSTVFVVQSTYPPTDQHMMQLLLISHHLSQEGAKVHAVVPYLAYARQDKQFLPGEVVSLGVVSHLFRSVGVRRVTTVDIHSAEGLALFSIPIYSVSAVPALADHIRRNVKLGDVAVIAPDFGGSKRSEAFASVYGAKYLQFSKSRDRTTGDVKMQASKLDVKGKDVIIFDDIISTGGTVIAAAGLLHDAGASKVVAVCTHPLLVGEAEAKIKQVGVTDVIGTNTVPSKASKVDVSEVIASHVRTLTE
jgi:ribose-phosphate pyrophosphokinase